MFILDELVYYCEIENPVGAFLLTGEWGCGKTYLVENKLPEKLGDNYVVIRTSLFGFHTTEEIKNEVRKRWLMALSEEKGLKDMDSVAMQKFVAVTKKLVNVAKSVASESMQHIVGELASLIELCPVENRIGNKKVILVFDDLERSNIPATDILGCINEYGENQHFNIIIIANEEKIKSSESELSYAEIKEKIVQRTMCFSPDYREVVNRTISDLSDLDQGYKSFLEQNTDVLLTILSGAFDDEETIRQWEDDHIGMQDDYEATEAGITGLLNSRPHNIRSFKCAIQDFKRIYTLLDTYGITDKTSYLGSFVSYVMAFRAGMIDRNNASNQNLAYLYPGVYRSMYLFESEKIWIVDGIWNENAIRQQIEIDVQREKALEPADIVRTYTLYNMDEDDLEAGFPIVLQAAYDGNLTRDEYVLFIHNCRDSRNLRLELPEIDWQKVYMGITQRLDMERQQEAQILSRPINENDRDNFSEDEWRAYMRIADFENGYEAVYYQNRNEYIRLMSYDINKAFVETQNKLYDCFTDEMMDVTFNAFCQAKNAVKHEFGAYFHRIWYGCYTNRNIEAQTTENNFRELIRRLKELRSQYLRDKKNIAAKMTELFVDEIEKVLQEREEANQFIE